jgi:hypothetical protein
MFRYCCYGRNWARTPFCLVLLRPKIKGDKMVEPDKSDGRDDRSYEKRSELYKGNAEKDIDNDREIKDLIKRLIEIKSKESGLNLLISDLENNLYHEILRLSGLISMYRMKFSEDPPIQTILRFEELFDKYVKPRKK